MEREVAIKKLTAILGKSMGYRVNPKAATPGERAAAQEALKPAYEERNKLQAQRDERRRAILAADAEYQSLCASAKAASENVDQLGSITRRYKITVGKMTSIFFHVLAEGDSWEEVIAKLTEKKAA